MIPSSDTLKRAAQILQEIESLQVELAGLFGSKSVAGAPAKRRGRPPGKRRKMSPEARARIASAAKARWARYRADKKSVAK
ncbi:MAG: hypothetical protein AB7O66_03800 [Limisphaerales bacterium]